MKLAAIYNVFDGLELLKGSIQQIRHQVDSVIVVSQEKSNFGEVDKSVYPFIQSLMNQGLVDGQIKYDPRRNPAKKNETIKRQMGINWAKSQGFTHFICMDCDEYYDTFEFARAKSEIEKEGYVGTACSIWTYYKSPTLRFENPDSYFVPFIHEIQNYTKTGYPKYPVKVDPTRGIYHTGQFWHVPDLLCSMHHYSYIRKDIRKKLRNSTAKMRIDNNQVLSDYQKAEEGYFVSGFGQRLISVVNKFEVDDYSKESTNVC